MIIFSPKFLKVPSACNNNFEMFVGNEFSKGIKALEEIDRKYILELYDSLSVQNNPYIGMLSYSSKVLEVVNNLLGKSNQNPLFVTSGSCVFDSKGNFVGIVFALSLSQFRGHPVLLESMIWVEPYTSIDWESTKRFMKALN